MIRTARVARRIVPCLATLPALALSQVVRDGTIGPGANVQPAGPSYLISQDMGARAGDNLFHSFELFSLAEGERATFAGDFGIDNVIARVTGPQTSFIDGVLGSSIAGANLWLLNPRGVMFGAHARIDLTGALNVSTAGTLDFDDGAALRADAGAPPVLSVASPTAFRLLGGAPGRIEVSGVQLKNPHGFALRSGVIEISDRGGLATSALGGFPGGDIELFASQRISLIDAPPGVGQQIFGTLDSRAVGATDAGDIRLEAPVIELVDGADVRSVTFGSGAGGRISIVADESLALYGLSAATGQSSQINSIAASTGRGGDVDVLTSSLVMDDAARLWSLTSGPGAGGHVTVDAGSIFAEASSQIYSLTRGPGRGGDVTVTASGEIMLGGLASDLKFGFGASIGARSAENADGQGGTVRIESPVIVLIDGGRIDTSAFSTGDGGDVWIEAESITVSGHGPIASFIGATSLGSGNAGDVHVHTARLVLDSGGTIVSDAFGSGRGGDIFIVATESVRMLAGDAARPDVAEVGEQGDDNRAQRLAMRAPPPEGRLYSGFIAANARSDGAAGSISITAPSVRLADGAAVTSSTTGSADGGRIVITADELVLDGKVMDDRSPTQIRAESGVDSRQASGDGGKITLIVGRLDVTNGATISSSSYGVGDAGDIRIAARDGIRIENGRIATEALEASGGNINLSAGGGIMLTGGEISTSVMRGSGRGGNITIGADPEHGVDGTSRVVLNDSRIVAEADAGSGGTIEISSRVFMASSNSVVDASAATGVDGQVRIDAVDLATEAPVENIVAHYVDAASLLRQQCAARDGRFAVRTRRGQPASPEEMLLAFDAIDRGVTPGVVQYAAVAASALIDGELMLRSGRGEDAAALFRGVARSADAAGDAAAEADALRGLGQSLQARGLYADSVAPLRSALALAEDIDDQGRASAALVNLGNAQLALGETSAADASLTRAVVLARQLDDPPLLATAVNAVGNKYVSGADFEHALATFEESAELARRAGDHSLELRALANAARAALRAGEPTRAQALMVEAGASVAVLPPTPEKVQLLVHLGRSHAELAAASPALREAGLLAAFESLSTAEALARSMPGQARALSFALGNLAALYAQEHRVPEALYLNARALAAAEEAGAADAAYRWHWQEGRLQWARGQPNAAIGAYRRAVDLLEETRQGGLSRYGATSNHFREAIAPVYLDLVDALLRASEMVGYPEDEALLFEEARQTMEQLKAAELRDYFRDECAAEWQDVFQSHWPATAIVYPIVLADRLELLVSLPEGIERHRVAVSAEDLTRAVHTFRRQLEERASFRQYRTTAMELYEWLVAPYAGALAAAGVETLVFVPDGALRSIPMSALHDGEDFLVARYATVTAASLALTDPRPLHASRHALLAGVSDSVAGFPGLAHVPRELNSIRAAYGGTLLLDEDFTRARFEDAMAQRQPAIVHIASHGQFTGDPATSFLLTHDGALSMSELEQSVSARRIPLELLVLSACQTAAGDYRAALGLAGVSLRAGAHSAVGSLWNVSDAATALLFEAFYARLREPDSSRAVAMRAAQLALVESERFSHPFFWSGFLLINSWL
jgi:filamentous hemagglutinin family protein